MMSTRFVAVTPSVLFSAFLLLLGVPTQAAVVTSTADSGPGSLRQAILDAASGDTITFTNTLSGATILLTGGTQLLLDKSLTINGDSLSNGISIDGNANSRIFELQAGTTNHLISLTLTNGYPSGNGGAISIQAGAFASISNCTLIGNLAGPISARGGGVNNDGTLDITDSSIKGNTAATFGLGTGGGIHNGDNGTLFLAGCVLSGNADGTSGNGGGAIYNRNSATITSCILSNNSAAGGGGGVVNFQNSSLSVSNSLFTGNTTTSSSGGGIAGYNGVLMLNGVIFHGNSAPAGGGVLAQGTMGMTDCLFTNNTAATFQGGAIEFEITTGVVARCTFVANVATTDAGAISMQSGDVTVSSSTLTDNTSGNGGGGIYQAGGTLVLNGATIVSNAAEVSGGAVEKGGGSLFITNSILALNTAPSNPNVGGGLTGGCNNLTGGDPLLSPLGNYGGDLPTMPPQLGSPVIDAGLTSATNSTTDQRGFPRVLSAGLGAPAVDIGACEFNGWLLGVDLTLLETNLLYIPPGSVYDSSTVFPPAIDPVAVGLTKLQTQAEIADLVGQGEANVTNNPSAYGLFTESAFQALALDRPFLKYDSASTTFTLTLGILQAPDLMTTFSNLTGFTTFPAPGSGQIDVEFSPPNSDVQFYEVYGAEPTP